MTNSNQREWQAISNATPEPASTLPVGHHSDGFKIYILILAWPTIAPMIICSKLHVSFRAMIFSVRSRLQNPEELIVSKFPFPSLISLGGKQQPCAIVTDRQRRRILSLMPLMVLAAGPLAANQEGSRIGMVGRATGQAFAKLSSTRALVASADILLGDLVWTDAQARLGLDLDGGTKIFLGEKARLKIDEFVAKDGGTLVLGDGSMVFDRPDNLPKTNMSVRTAFGLIGVRGTRFFAGQSRGAFGIFCERGAVAVSAAGIERQLAPGEGVDIARAGAAPGDVTRWGDARIAEALASVLG
jgi:hypothetical protein